MVQTWSESEAGAPNSHFSTFLAGSGILKGGEPHSLHSAIGLPPDCLSPHLVQRIRRKPHLLCVSAPVLATGQQLVWSGPPPSPAPSPLPACHQKARNRAAVWGHIRMALMGCMAVSAPRWPAAHHLLGGLLGGLEPAVLQA